MHAIIKFWYYSLALWHPTKLFGLAKSSLRTLIKATGLFAPLFGLLIVIDIAISLLFGDVLAKAIPLFSTGKNVGFPVLIIILAQSVTWFLIIASFFLLMRKNDTRDTKEYFRLYFYKYMQLLLFFSFLLLITMYCLLVAGITKMPKPQWWLFTAIKVTEYTTALYWLDSTGGLGNMIKSLEKTTNLFFYNLPFMPFLIGLLWLFDFGVCSLAQAVLESSPAHLLFSNGFDQLASSPATTKLLLKVVAIKYTTFFLEILWLSLLLAFYRRKKDDQYATSIFTQAS